MSQEVISLSAAFAVLALSGWWELTGRAFIARKARELTLPARRQSQRVTHEHSGIVEAENSKGVKLDGQWLNFSKDLELATHPAVGDHVEITYSMWQDKPWISRLEITSQAAPTPPAAPDDDYIPDLPGGPESDVPLDGSYDFEPPRYHFPHLSDREWLMVRQSALKDACAAMAAITPPASSLQEAYRTAGHLEDAILAMAENMVKWLAKHRPDVSEDY